MIWYWGLGGLAFVAGCCPLNNLRILSLLLSNQDMQALTFDCVRACRRFRIKAAIFGP